MTLLPYLIPARRVLVVAPSRLLRGQVGSEFSRLATLRRMGICPDDMPGPQVFEVPKVLGDVLSREALGITT